VTHIDAYREKGEAAAGGEVALLRNVHVTSELAPACDQLPILAGEWVVVVIESETVTDCAVHQSMNEAREDYKSRLV
jgi:molybdenum cofactor biosynthesis enzyme